MSRALLLSATLALGLLTTSVALAAPSAKMTAALRPERLGKPTTISASFQVGWTEPRPPILTGVQLAYPNDLGFATSGLGLAACDRALIEENGPAACPANSQIGQGSALVEIPLSGFLHAERAQLTLLAAPSPNGYVHVSVAGVGSFPVSAVVVLSAELLPGGLGIAIPPIPTLPEGPYVSLVEMHLQLGGRLTYFEHVRGKTVAYHPPGIGLPRTCPRGGFRFAATFAFLGGEHARAQTRVACPRPG